MTPSAQQGSAGENRLARARGIRARSAHSTQKVQTVCIFGFGPSANSAVTAGVVMPLLPKARPLPPQRPQPRPTTPEPPLRPDRPAAGRLAPIEPSTQPKPPLTWPSVPNAIPPLPVHPVVPARPRFAGLPDGIQVCSRGWRGPDPAVATLRGSATGAGRSAVVEQGCVCRNACVRTLFCRGGESYEPR
jgi:hypothetical protein